MIVYDNKHKKQCQKIHRYTIMFDSWTDLTKLYIINFMIYSKKIIMFLKLVDASNNFKDHKYIGKLFNNIIKEVRVENII